MYGLDYVALRYFNVYGPRMDIHGVYTEVLVRWMERIEAGQPPMILGDGNQTMDFVYVDDIAGPTCWRRSPRSPTRSSTWRAASETSSRDLAATLLRVMGSDLEPEFGPERKVNPVRAAPGRHTGARELLGFEAAGHALEAGLGSLVEWWRASRARPPPCSGRSAARRSR